MPQAIGLIAAYASTAAGVAAGALPISSAAVLAISTAAGTIASTGALLGASALLSAATKPGIPTPEAGKINRKTTMGPRRIGYGIARLGGAYMLRETSGNILHVVLAVAEGPVQSVEAWYLNDDLVTVTGGVVQQLASGAYETGRVILESRLGATTETVYASAASELPSVWDSTHRGDGVFSIHMRAQNGKLADFTKQFPNSEPQPTVVAKLSKVYDWRVGGASRTDPTTWVWSQNPVVCHVHDLWFRRGRSWTRRFAPSLSILTTSANYCDALVALADGSTKPRYELGGGFYDSTTEPGDIDGLFLSCHDGFMMEQGDGSIVIFPGRYDDPGDDATFDDRSIKGLDLQRWVPDEQIVNQLVCSFVDPANAYSTVETTPWVNQADITARGVIRSQPFAPPWVQRNDQVRRLAKRAMSRNAAELRGTMITDLTGLKALGKRYLRIQSSRLARLNNLVVEVTGSPTIDWSSLSISWPIIQADPHIDDWDPATEEGTGVSGAVRPVVAALAAPTITGITAQSESGGVRLDITGTGPARDDLTWSWRWRLNGSGEPWVVGDADDNDPSSTAVELLTGFVTQASLEVQIAYTTGGGTLSPWTASTVFSAALAVPSPTNLTATGAAGSAALSFRFPTSAVDHVIWRRNTTNTYSTGSDIVSRTGALGATDSYTDTVAAGSYYWWATAYDASGTPSAHAGPVTATVT